jgi:hypothetical protein
MPPFLLPDVIEHLEQFTGTADDQLVISGPKGAQLGGATSPVNGARR